MIKLGVNVDHVATLRQVRLAAYPDPVEASLAAQRAGAQAITVHLREDRRHIQDRDLFRIREAIKIHLNQEMAPIAEMLEIALELKPDEVCLVPERREELTTEGGLDAAGLQSRLAPLVERLRQAEIAVSLFIDPAPHQVQAAAALGVDFVEIHTGTYANLADAGVSSQTKPGSRTRAAGPPRSAEADAELGRIRAAARLARALKLKPNAGHGLNYQNVAPVAATAGIAWLHIGHSIIARALMVGMERAVREMLALIKRQPIGRRLR